MQKDSGVVIPEERKEAETTENRKQKRRKR